MNKIKIAIIGSESSGKTTLATALANELNADLVLEYARIFLREKNNQYDENDLLYIAQKQIEQENIATQKKVNHIVICDTNISVIKIWSEVKYNNCNVALLNLALQQQYDMVLLCKPNLPWQYDPMREHPNEQDRIMLYNLYIEECLLYSYPFFIIDKIGEQRTSQAMHIVNDFLKHNNITS